MAQASLSRSDPQDYGRRIAEALERIATALEGSSPAAEPDEALPEDFPGLAALHEAGILFYETLPRTGPGLMALGLDGVTINRVLTRLKRDG